MNAEQQHVKKLKPKTKVAEEYLRAHPDAMRPAFIAAEGVMISSGSFAHVKRRVRTALGLPPMVRGKVEQPDMFAQVITKAPSKQTSELTTAWDRVAELEEELGYLQWKCEGERHSYIQRLLDDEAL